MRQLRLAVALLFLAAATARAASGSAPPAAGARIAAEGWPKNVEVVAHGNDKAQEHRALELLAALSRRYPRLFKEDILRKVVLEVFTEQEDPGIKFNPGTTVAEYGRGSGTITINPRNLFSIEAKVAPGVYKPGKVPEAIVFHELLHGLEEALPAIAEGYEEHVADGILERIRAESDAVHRADATGALHRRYYYAEMRVAIAKGMTKDQYVQHVAEHSDPPMTAQGRQHAEAEYDRVAAMDLAEAQRLRAQNKSEDQGTAAQAAVCLGIGVEGVDAKEVGSQVEAALKKGGPQAKDCIDKARSWRKANTEIGRVEGERDAADQERLVRYKIPQRKPGDFEVITNPWEFFAHSGEFFFYAQDPNRYYYTDKAKAFWLGLGDYLTGKGPLPAY